MARSIYITSVEADSAKSIVALGLIEALKRQHERVGSFRPVLPRGEGADHAMEILEARDSLDASHDLHCGVTYATWQSDPEAALVRILERFEILQRQCDVVVIHGSDFTDLPGGNELSMNATIAANLGAPMLAVLPGNHLAGSQLAQSAELVLSTVAASHGTVIALVANRCQPAALSAQVATLSELGLPSAAVAEYGEIDLASPENVQGAIDTFTASVDAAPFIAAMENFTTTVLTPAAFQAGLLTRAKACIRHIVLPEGEDDRILEAAAKVVELGAAKVSILGEVPAMTARAKELGIDLSGADLVDPQDPELIDRFATEFAKLRASKGVTYEDAVATFKESKTYFATMMVHLGLADGMVSGACNTTADTIRPSFQIIKTMPGVAIVSSVFLMALADRVLVFGDCAVNPNPTPDQLAGIALSSAKTAQAFGIEPRVAMISYSTGTSGAGPDVDAVTEAVALAQQADPDLALDGPLQYDAAVVPKVAASKRPGSAVAGQATVLIFPDLNTGNAVYKAVQRSAGALAVGPVLQGLNKPVNDLSRGALVEDIVNTVIITACQAA